MFSLNFSFKSTWNNVCKTSNTFVHHTIKLKHKESDECPARMSHSLSIQMVWTKKIKKHITIGRLSSACNCTSFLRSVPIHTRALIFQHGTEMRNEDEWPFPPRAGWSGSRWADFYDCYLLPGMTERPPRHRRDTATTGSRFRRWQANPDNFHSMVPLLHSAFH